MKYKTFKSWPVSCKEFKCIRCPDRLMQGTLKTIIKKAVPSDSKLFKQKRLILVRVRRFFDPASEINDYHQHI